MNGATTTAAGGRVRVLAPRRARGWDLPQPRRSRDSEPRPYRDWEQRPDGLWLVPVPAQAQREKGRGVIRRLLHGAEIVASGITVAVLINVVLYLTTGVI